MLKFARRMLFPDPQWDDLERLWRAMYPTSGLNRVMTEIIDGLEGTLCEFVRELINHRPQSLSGDSLREVMSLAERQPAKLRARFDLWRSLPRLMYEAQPTEVFAVFGQARWDGTLDAKRETALLTDLLSHWALRRATGTRGIADSFKYTHEFSGAV